MKKLLFILLLLPTFAHADVPVRLDSLTARMKIALFGTTSYNFRANSFFWGCLNEAGSEVGSWPGAVEKMDTIITHPDTLFYTPSATVKNYLWAGEYHATLGQRGAYIRYLKAIPSIEVAGNRYHLTADLNKQVADWAPGERSEFFLVSANRIGFFPPRKIADTIIVAFESYQGHLDTTAADTLVIRSEYREAFFNYACWKAADRLGLPVAAAFERAYVRMKGANANAAAQ